MTWALRTFVSESEEYSCLKEFSNPMHLLVIFGIALLVFGPKKPSELGKGIGGGIRRFKSAMKEPEESQEKDVLSGQNQT
jgi:sec-independent protein translocase protein TatA